MIIKDWSKESAYWFYCVCGCVYQTNPLKRLWGADYVQSYKDQKRLKERFELFIRITMGFVEEIAYGRRFLDVGSTVPDLMDKMKERGWIPEGIDLNKTDFAIEGDFETYDFKDKKYDLINFGNILHCFNDPVGAINKAFRLLEPNGVIIANTPDAELQYLYPHPMEWGHWNCQNHRVYFSRRQLVKTFETAGFEIIANWRNTSDRLFSFNEAYIIAQKPLHYLERSGDKKEAVYGKNDKSGTA